MVSWRHKALLVVLLILAQATLVFAEIDPEARAEAERLLPLYRQTVNGPTEPFRQAFIADPVMTRKVYLCALGLYWEQSATNPKASLEWFNYAKALAALIDKQFADPGAGAIISEIEAKRFLKAIELGAAYALPLYPKFVAIDSATQRYGDFEFRPANWNAVDKLACFQLYAVFGRLNLAQSYACFDQGIQQAELASNVISQAAKWVTEHGGDPGVQSILSFFQTGMASFRAASLAELGLLEEATAQLPALLDRQEHRNYRSAVLLSCARTALQQGKTTEALSYLSQAETKLNPSFVPPPLRFALSTAGYQARRQQGYLPTAAQKAEDFQQTWNQAFAGYRPFERVQADAYWYYARKATRYWLTELEPGPESVEVCQELYLRLEQWLPTFLDVFKQNPSATIEDWFYNPEQGGNWGGTVIGLTDLWMAVVERLPEKDPARVKFVPSFEPILMGIEAWAGTQKDTGQYPFSLTDSGLLLELRGRLDLIKARDLSRPVAERVKLAGAAADLITKSGDPEATLSSLLSAGTVLRTLGRSDLAIEKWKKALEIAGSLSYIEKAMQAASLLAAEYGRQEKWREAGVYADQASKMIQESVVLVASDPEASRRLSQTSDQVTEVSVKAASAANDPAKALAALVRGKEAQSAAAQVRGQTDTAEVVAVTQHQQEVAALSAQVQKLEGLPASTARDALLAKSQKLLADTKADFLLRVRELRQKYPDLYSRVLKFDPLDLPDVQQVLPSDTAVIQYFPTADGLYVFLVTRDTFRMHLVPVTEKELDASVSTYIRAIRRSQSGDPQLEAESKALYASLIEPCRAALDGKTTLVLIPSGHLNSLPFASLTNPSGAPLIESKLILELAKPTDFLRIAQNPPRKVVTVVAFANATGDLPAAGVEGDQIAALFPGSKLFKGKDATKKNFFAFGADAEVLHLATHGESNSVNSLTNYLKMTGGERVAQEEIFALTLNNTSIVTLSACNTAVGDNLDSRFVASLAEAFWLGGSQTVVASLWAVNDTSTGLLMAEFYSGLKEGKGKAQALKDAQMKVRGTSGYEHPYYWAGFLLFGDWR